MTARQSRTNKERERKTGRRRRGGKDDEDEREKNLTNEKRREVAMGNHATSHTSFTLSFVFWVLYGACAKAGNMKKKNTPDKKIRFYFFL